MTFASRVRALLAGAFQAGPLPWLGDRIVAGGVTLPAVVSPAGALALTGVYRACSLLSDAVSLAPPAIYLKQEAGGRLQQTNTAAARTLATLTHADAEMFAFSCALSGNGFLRILRDQTGAPFELRAIASWRVQLMIDDKTGALVYRVAADKSVEEPQMDVPAASMIHAKYRMTGGNRYWGVPPAASCSPSFALALQSRAVLRYLFANLASPGGVLQAPGKLDPVLAKRMQAEFDANYSGSGTGKTAVLSNGLEYKSIVWKASDAQLLEQINASTLDIARAYSIPKSFLEDGTQMTYASASEATRSLYALALQHFCARCADALAQKLLTRNDRAAGATIEYDLTSLLIMPGAEMADFLTKLAGGPVATVNELRNQYLALPDVEGGGSLRAPQSATPAPALAAGGTP